MKSIVSGNRIPAFEAAKPDGTSIKIMREDKQQQRATMYEYDEGKLATDR